MNTNFNDLSGDAQFPDPRARSNSFYPSKGVCSRTYCVVDEQRKIQIAEIYREAFSGPPWFETWNEKSAVKAIDRYLENGPRVVTLEFYDCVVAFAIALPVKADEKFLNRWKEHIPETAVYLAEFAVASAYRGQGLGIEVLKALQSGAKAAGSSSICTRTRSDNTPAIRAFLKVGMREVGEYQAESGGLVSARKVFLGNL